MGRLFPSEAQLRVLVVLEREPRLYGLQIVRKLRMKRGQYSTIYTLLTLLRRKGYVKRLADPEKHSGAPRHPYVITPTGKRVLRAWRHIHGVRLR